jgi:hypothetical protein
MIQRCTNPRRNNYYLYGGRGISVCGRWRDSFQSFVADMGPRPDGCTLDRVDNDGNYEPGNCRWATAKEQSENSRMCRGVDRAASKLTEDQVYAVKRVGVLDVFSGRQIARWFGVSQMSIQAILKNKKWRHVP